MSNYILTIDYRDYLFTSKAKALAAMGALMDSVRVFEAGDGRFEVDKVPQCSIKPVGKLRSVKREPVDPPAKPAPKPTPSRPARSAEEIWAAPTSTGNIVPAAAVKPEPKPQQVFPQPIVPVSRRTARACLSLIARSIDDTVDVTPLPPHNVIALPAPASGEPEQFALFLEGGSR